MSFKQNTVLLSLLLLLFFRSMVTCDSEGVEKSQYKKKYDRLINPSKSNFSYGLSN